MSISHDLMQKFIKAASDRLVGNWVIIGGSILHLLNIGIRPTEDIDLAGPAEATQSDLLEMLTIADELGLPIEAINQAGAFYLHKIPDWQSRLIIVSRGSKGTISRPNLELFFELKLARNSESDMVDCLNLLDYAIKNKEPFDRNKLIQTCKNRLVHSNSPDRIQRLIDVISVSNS